jgi:biopolymer transport protein ExbD
MRMVRAGARGSRKARRRIRSGLLGVLPMTSMIDVVFLLLIFFMVTASFSAEEDKLSSALGADGAGTPTTLQPQIVRVRDLNGVTVYEIGSHRLQTTNSLANILRALPKDQGVVFRVSDTVPIADVAGAMQAAYDAGYTKRSYVASSEP